MIEPAMAVDELTPLGFRVFCSWESWQRIATIKHPAILNKLEEVRRTLREPVAVCRSVGDPNVVLFYSQVEPRLICAVVKRANDSGYLITA